MSEDLDQGLPIFIYNSLFTKASMRIELWFDYSAQLGFLLKRIHF